MENVTFCFPSCCSFALTLGLMTKLYEVIIHTVKILGFSQKKWYKGFYAKNVVPDDI